MQDRVNFLKYLEDGCHFTSEGRAKYIGSLRRFMFKYKSLLPKCLTCVIDGMKPNALFFIDLIVAIL